MSKSFGNGAGHVLRQRNSAVLRFSWRGKPDGSARCVERVNRYPPASIVPASLSAVLALEHLDAVPGVCV